MEWVGLCLFVDDTVFVESEEELQRVVDEFYSVCTRWKLKVIVGKSKVMVFERREAEVVYFNTPYRLSVPAIGKCEVFLGEKVEEVKTFKYLEAVLRKHEEMEGEKAGIL